MPEFSINRHDLLDLGEVGRGTSLDAATRLRLMATINRAESVVRLHVEHPGERTSYAGWLSADAVVVHVDADPATPVPAWYGSASALPSIVGLLAGMGERLMPSGRHAVTTRAELAGAVTGDGAPIAGFGAVVTVWTLEWSSSSGTQEGLSVVDQGPGAPMWRVAGATSTDSVHLEDAGSFDIWRRLGEVLASVTSGEESAATVGLLPA